ncbi:MAG: 50S ribosomal protein L17 [Phycisphaerae bacterium]|nr:50S ribosomal protein L17 [Phycisphaerae bacterium]
MRHRIAHYQLGRTRDHRRALRRNLAQSLFEHGQITSTVTKVKAVRRFVERLITLAKQARFDEDKVRQLSARRRIHHLLSERQFIPAENMTEYLGLSDSERQTVRQARTGRYHRTGAGKGTLTFTGRMISHRLINDWAERYQNRTGGYTRIIRLSKRRVGDQGEQAILQLVGTEEVPTNVPKKGRSQRRKKADLRYAAVLKGIKKSKPVTATTESENSATPDST